MENLIYETISQLANLIPEGTILIIAPGRVSLIDARDLTPIGGVRLVAHEIMVQSSQGQCERFHSEIKKTCDGAGDETL